MLTYLIDIQQHITSRFITFVQAEQMNRQHTVSLLRYLPLRRFVRHMCNNQVLVLTGYNPQCLYVIKLVQLLTFELLSTINTQH